MRSFESAARNRSISKAANELGCGQPTVTTHIKKLEQELKETNEIDEDETFERYSY